MGYVLLEILIEALSETSELDIVLESREDILGLPWFFGILFLSLRGREKGSHYLLEVLLGDLGVEREVRVVLARQLSFLHQNKIYPCEL